MIRWFINSLHSKSNQSSYLVFSGSHSSNKIEIRLNQARWILFGNNKKNSLYLWLIRSIYNIFIIDQSIIYLFIKYWLFSLHYCIILKSKKKWRLWCDIMMMKSSSIQLFDVNITESKSLYQKWKGKKYGSNPFITKDYR